DGPNAFLLTLPLACLFIARALDGFTGGNIAVANAYMADISNDENRGENFGQMSASMSLAFVLGPALAGLLSTTILEELLPVLVAAVISLVTMLLIQLWLKETIDLPPNPTRPRRILSRFFGQAHKSCRNPDTRRAKLKDLLQLENIPLMFLLYLMVFLSFSLFYVGFPVYSSQVLGWSAKELGGFLAISSLIMFGVNTYGIKYLNRYTGPRQLMLSGAILMAISFALLTLDNFFALAAANVLLSVGNGVLWPSFMSVLSESSPPDKIGGIMGWGNSMGSLGSILGLLIGGFLYTHIGPRLFFLGSLLFLTVFILILFYFGNQNKAMD
ncbi:MAG TPA: MFS transporter, partial [Saprospiraceae bacterium]|nr:MFS transporter [Saprospiraceae bacterium]